MNAINSPRVSSIFINKVICPQVNHGFNGFKYTDNFKLFNITDTYVKSVKTRILHKIKTQFLMQASKMTLYSYFVLK